MANKIMITFVVMDLLFLASGIILLAFPLIAEAQMVLVPTVDTVARNLVFLRCPLTASVVNAVVVFITFLTSVPAILMPTTRGWLKFHGYLVVVCALFTLILGLDIWFDTLMTRSNLSTVWAAQSASTQSLLQQELLCCGYPNSTSPPFVTDDVCSSALVAAQLGDCVGPFSTFANNLLDLIFTAAFGLVGIDVALILAIAMLLKDRKERERYRHIDRKNGIGRI